MILACQLSPVMESWAGDAPSVTVSECDGVLGDRGGGGGGGGWASLMASRRDAAEAKFSNAMAFSRLAFSIAPGSAIRLAFSLSRSLEATA